MSDTWNVTITLAPPAGTGPVLLAGATSVLGWALDELDLEHDHYIEGTRADCAVIEMVNVVADDISEEDLTAKVATAVHDLIAQIWSWPAGESKSRRHHHRPKTTKRT